MWLWILALSCAKEIPPHLRVEPTPQSAFDISLPGLIGSDPLTRRPNAGPQGAWRTLPQGHAIEAWATVARRANPQPTHWAEVEAQYRGTIAVPLSRGARLAGLEVAHGDGSIPHQQQIAAWLGLTRVAARPGTQRPSEPLEWLPGRTIDEKREVGHHIASRWVLRGWLDGPSIDLGPVAKALQGPAYTGLADSPHGRLIRARAEGQVGPTEEAEVALWAATSAALKWAMADGRKARKAQHEARRLHRSTHETDLVEAQLNTAIDGLILNARVDESTGMALVAIEAARLNRACTDPPCEGLDRVRSLHDADRWGPQTARAAATWRVIALKEALDTLTVAIDQPILHRRLPQVVEAIAGADGEPVQLPMLRHRIESPVLLAALSQLASGTPQTTRAPALKAIKTQLIMVCEQAIQASPPPEIASDLKRLRDRLQRAITTD